VIASSYYYTRLCHLRTYLLCLLTLILFLANKDWRRRDDDFMPTTKANKAVSTKGKRVTKS
jgi:hypothetical protein